MPESSGAALRSSIHRSLYLAALRLRGNTLEHLGVLKLEESLTFEEVLVRQQVRLRRLLQHASSRVPYYGEILADSGVVTSSGEVDLDQFSKIPLLDKASLHHRFEELKSTDLNERKWYLASSSGSTGEPARFIQDQSYADWARAIAMHFDSWTGYVVGEPKSLLWPTLPNLGARQSRARLRLGMTLRNETMMDIRRMTSQSMYAFLERVHRNRPTLIQAFPENLFEIARLALREGIRPGSPRSIVTGAGNLFPSMRQTIEHAFGAPIFDRYGSMEVSGVAAECEAHSGLHVCSSIQHVEILRGDETPAMPGQLGEVVVTSLVNYAMPLIRYRIGDLAAWAGEECSCGRAWPLLSEVAGRTRDLFVRKDGSYVRVLERVFHEQPWIRKFQVVQEEYDLVRAFIVPYADVSDPLTEHAKGIQEIEKSIIGVMGPDCTVEILLVDHIEDSPSGKFRHHISKVRGPSWESRPN